MERRPSTRIRVPAWISLGLAAALAGCYENPSDSHPCADCLPCELCVDGPYGPSCEASSHAGTACGEDGDIHWADSCGGVEEDAVSCPAGHGQCVEIDDQTAGCDCLEHWAGEDCTTCPPHWDPTQSCAACAGNWIDDGNDCGTCPGNWDASQDCAFCTNSWTGPDCETCPGNWDPSTDCDACVGGWDLSANCEECVGNWDEAADCEACLAGWFGTGCDQAIRYADAASLAAAPDGESWETAFPDLKDAVYTCGELIDDAVATSCDVWVAQGVYFIFETSSTDSLRLRSGVSVYGGFAGTETALDERDWVANETVLDGLQAEGSPNAVYHVVTGADDATLDGFTIRNGTADGPSDSGQDAGGGMRNADVSPTVRNSIFANNSASNRAGAVDNISNSAVFEDCEFNDNTADYGGAMYNEFSSVSVFGCRFEGNTCGARGGAVYNSDCSPHFSGCVFSANASGATGGAMNNEAGSPEVSNCVFSDNYATQGGAVLNDGSPARFLNSVFYSNGATWGGGIYNFYSDSLIANCIVWIGDVFNGSTSTPEITYCDVQGGATGSGNISADPLFVDALNGDFHLQAGSPCIDAADGDHASDLDMGGNARVDDPDTANTGINDPPYADIGAFEFTGD